nr:hypothetical protein [Tanacetum cinerariifolium]
MAEPLGTNGFLKKKTYMNSKVHTFKACLVAKDYTQTYKVDYRKTFSPVAADIRRSTYILGIKITKDRSKRLIALSQNAYFDKILKKFKMENSKRGNIPMQEKPNLIKAQGASKPEEVKRMQRVLYASAIGSIMNSKDMVLVYGEIFEDELRVTCYANAGLQIDKDDTISQSRYFCVLNEGVID